MIQSRFPILKKIQQEVDKLKKIGNIQLKPENPNVQSFTGATNSQELWYKKMSESQVTKKNYVYDLKQLIEKTKQILLDYNPHLLEHFKVFISENQLTLNIYQATQSSGIADACIQSYKASLKFIMHLINDKETRKRRESVQLSQVSQPEITSVDVQRKSSLYTLPTQKADKSKQQRINELQAQNLKLGFEVTQLAEKLRKFEQSQDVATLKSLIEKLKTDSESEISNLKALNEQKEKQILKNNQLVVQLKAIIQKLEIQITGLQQYIDDNQSRFTMMENTYDAVFEDRAYWREFALMEQEDLLGQQERFERYIQEELRSKKKLISLRQEIDKIKIEKSKLFIIPEFNKVDEEKFIKLRYLFTQDKFYQIQMREIIQQKISQLNEQEDQSMMFLKNLKLELKYQDQLHKYTYPRQSFLIFYEKQMKLIEQEFKTIEHHRISATFFGTIRAILDSKYNEFQFIENFKSCSKFGDFVYAWISYYNVDKTTRRVSLITEKNQSVLDLQKMDFLLDILNPKLSKVNECITFNEFLFEQGSLDELYYYLHVRFLLFKGNLQYQSRYSFDTIIYISIDHAQRVAELVMHKYDPNNISQVKKTLMEQSIEKGKFTMIDGHYALRIFLELYRQERKNRLNLLKEMFHACVQLQSTGKYGISYKNFRKIFQFNFPDAQEVDICSLYREAHMCGDGSVTAESFFTAATETNFFITQLQLRTLFNPPKLEFYKIQYCEENLPYIDFINHYNELPHQIINKLCIEMGVEHIHHEIKRMQIFIEGMMQYQFNHKSLLQNVANLLCIYHKIIALRLNQETIYNGDMSLLELDSLKTTLLNFKQIFYPLIELDQKDKILQLTKHSKVKILQITGKRKAQKFYALLSAVLSSKLHQIPSKDVSPKRKSMEDMSPKKRQSQEDFSPKRKSMEEQSPKKKVPRQSSRRQF